MIIFFMIGFWANRYVKSSNSFLQEYFLGGRELGGFVLAMTMIATYGSASSFIGGPGVAYTDGIGLGAYFRWHSFQWGTLCSWY